MLQPWLLVHAVSLSWSLQISGINYSVSLLLGATPFSVIVIIHTGTLASSIVSLCCHHSRDIRKRLVFHPAPKRHWSGPRSINALQAFFAQNPPAFIHSSIHPSLHSRLGRSFPRHFLGLFTFDLGFPFRPSCHGIAFTRKTFRSTRTPLSTVSTCIDLVGYPLPCISCIRFRNQPPTSQIFLESSSPHISHARASALERCFPLSFFSPRISLAFSSILTHFFHVPFPSPSLLMLKFAHQPHPQTRPNYMVPPRRP